jgi:hypothetical protein
MKSLLESVGRAIESAQRLWKRHELTVALLLIAGGFLAVFFGWLEASGTADMRIQLQDCISGGVGGLALILIGAVLAHSHVADRAAERTEALLQQLVEGRADLAVDAEPDLALAGTVRATRASYHLAGCDLLGSDSADVMTVRQAQRTGLAPCRVCAPGGAS